MDYSVFHCSRIGAAHIKKGLPIQDRSAALDGNGYQIAVVADGHGSRRHFRSDIGAQTACDTAIHAVREALEGNNGIVFDDLFFSKIKTRIVLEWQQKIKEHFSENPLNDTETEEQMKLLEEDRLERLLNGTDALIPYGTTLCAVFRDESGWGAVQVGDGCLTVVERDGSFLWPMPKSTINEGNKTASLCMNDPMQDFRHCWGKEQPAALLVYTDGIEKNFPPEGAEISSLLNWIIRNEKKGAEDRLSVLEKNLDMLTSRSRTGDDLSIAGMADRDAEEIKPKATTSQMLAEIDRINAKIRENETTIRYNETKRLDVNESDEAYGQLSKIIERKQNEIKDLKDLKEKTIEGLKNAGYDTNRIGNSDSPAFDKGGSKGTAAAEENLPEEEQAAPATEKTQPVVPCPNGGPGQMAYRGQGDKQTSGHKTNCSMTGRIGQMVREDWRIALLPLDIILITILIVCLIKGI